MTLYIFIYQQPGFSYSPDVAAGFFKNRKEAQEEGKRLSSAYKASVTFYAITGVKRDRDKLFRIE